MKERDRPAPKDVEMTQGCRDAIPLLGKKLDATEIAADLEISSKLQAAIAVFAKTIKDLEYESISKDG
jgi:hypothetical protein